MPTVNRDKILLQMPLSYQNQFSLQTVIGGMVTIILGLQKSQLAKEVREDQTTEVDKKEVKKEVDIPLKSLVSKSP